MSKKITVQAMVNTPIEKVWRLWTEPFHIVKWNFASDNWECTSASNDLRVGGSLKARMSAKEKSSGFDFTGVYTSVIIHKLIEYSMDDNRHVKIEFVPGSHGTKIRETFEIEHAYSEEQQRSGWQAILNNFKKYAEEKNE